MVAAYLQRGADIQTIAEPLRRQLLLITGESGAAEARIRRFDGAYRWFLMRVNPLRDQAGNVIRWYGVNTDIEDWRRTEESLRASERMLHSMVDSVAAVA